MPLNTPLQASARGVRRFLLEAVDLTSAHRYEAGGRATSDQVRQEIRRLEAVLHGASKLTIGRSRPAHLLR